MEKQFSRMTRCRILGSVKRKTLPFAVSFALLNALLAPFCVEAGTVPDAACDEQAAMMRAAAGEAPMMGTSAADVPPPEGAAAAAAAPPSKRQNAEESAIFVRR